MFKKLLLFVILAATSAKTFATDAFVKEGHPCEWRLLSDDELKNAEIKASLNEWRQFATGASALPLDAVTADNLEVVKLAKSMATLQRIEQTVTRVAPPSRISFFPLGIKPAGPPLFLRNDNGLVEVPLVQTAAGRMRLAQLLANPPSSVDEIRGRQEIVRYLSEDPKGLVLLNQMTEILGALSKLDHSQLFRAPETQRLRTGFGIGVQSLIAGVACATKSPWMLFNGCVYSSIFTPDPKSLNRELAARATYLNAVASLRALSLDGEAPRFLQVMWAFLNIAENGMTEAARASLRKSSGGSDGLDSLLDHWISPAAMAIQIRGHRVAQDMRGWLRLTSALADIDVLAGLARFAIAHQKPAQIYKGGEEANGVPGSGGVVDDPKNPFKGRVVFPEILDPKEHLPTLEIVDGQSPLFFLGLFQSSAPNTVRLSRANGPSVLAVMGPQEKGKTTTLRMVSGLTLMALIGSAVPATSMRLTPFHIQTAMNVSDDPASGLSLFAAKSRRLATILNLAQGSSTPQLLLGDEIFNGTSHEEQNAGELGAIRWVAQMPNAIALFSSNNRSIVQELAATPGVEVVHMGEKEGETPYRIHPGPSTVRNAHETLDRFGFPAEIVEEVRRASEEAVEASAPN